MSGEAGFVVAVAVLLGLTVDRAARVARRWALSTRPDVAGPLQSVRTQFTAQPPARPAD